GEGGAEEARRGGRGRDGLDGAGLGGVGRLGSGGVAAERRQEDRGRDAHREATQSHRVFPPSAATLAAGGSRVKPFPDDDVGRWPRSIPARRPRASGVASTRMPRPPEWMVPMAATLTQERFTGPEWVFERKLDGIRLLAFRDGSDVRLLSRNRLPQNDAYPSVVDAVARLPVR